MPKEKTDFALLASEFVRHPFYKHFNKMLEGRITMYKDSILAPRETEDKTMSQTEMERRILQELEILKEYPNGIIEAGKNIKKGGEFDEFHPYC